LGKVSCYIFEEQNMEKIELTKAALGPIEGMTTMVVLGVIMLLLAYYVRATLVRNTHDFVIAGRRLGFGFGVAGLISVWTWAMAVMMSSAMTYKYGLSGLFWFTVPNGFAVIAIIPFARRLRTLMPHGYTMSEFVGVRFSQSKFARIVVTIGLIFGALIAIIINLKGTALVISTIFGVDQGKVAIAAAIIVLIYSALGGLWVSMSTSTLATLIHTVPAAIVVVAVLSQLGGAPVIWEAVAHKGNELLSVTRSDAMSEFGITLALGLLTATLAGQDFWQVVWGLKKSEVSRTFLWAGTWFYPIPICLGVLGLTGIALNVDLASDLANDAAAVGPFVISHIGLPNWLIYIYAAIIVTACYSVIDSSLTAISGITAIDIINPLNPRVTEKNLFALTKLSMIVPTVLATLVVLSGADFVSIVLTTYAIRTAILIPLMLSIFWDKMTASGFIWGTILAIVIGMPCRMIYGELPGTLLILLVSAVVPVALSLRNSQKFDFSSLVNAEDLKPTSQVVEQAR